MDSILNTIKHTLDIEDDYTGFDIDIILGINTALSTLTQLGVGPVGGFSIEDSSQNWVDFLGDSKNLEAVKSYIGLKVRLMFDPPTSSFVVDAISRQITELEWRLQVQVDPPSMKKQYVTRGSIFDWLTDLDSIT
jgi:hypothetical protein